MMDGVFREVLILAEVGAVGDHGAHGKRQGEEHLAAGRCKNFHEAGRLVKEARLQSVAGDEHVLEAASAFGSVQARMMTMTSMTNSAGMPIVLNFSMPPADTAAVDEIADEHEQNHAADAGPRLVSRAPKELLSGMPLNMPTTLMTM